MSQGEHTKKQLENKIIKLKEKIILWEKWSNKERNVTQGINNIEKTTAKIRLIFAWYDLWVGMYIDRKAKKLYIFPVPCIGIAISYT